MTNCCNSIARIVLPCLAGALLVGCGGPTATPGPGRQVAPGPLALPAPAALTPHTAAFTLAEGFSDGSAFDATKPHNRASAAGTDCALAPALGAGSANSAADLAYAIYDFHLPNYGGGLADVRFNWSDHPDAGTEFVALANFSTNRWEWTADPAADKLTFNSIAPYISASDHFYLAVAVTGTHAAILDSLQVSEQQAPVADLTSDVDSGTAPLTVNFDASGSTDADGTIVDYEWDFDGNGTFSEAGDEASAHGQATPAAVVYTTVGSYTVSVRVTDNDGKTGVAQLDINVTSSQPPTADLTANMSNGPKPLAVSFDASGSSDPDGTITDYEWDFDGNNVYNEAGPEAAARGTATPAAYTYTAVGSYTARVRVTDNDSNKDVATLPITVTNTPPTAMLTANVTDGDAPLAVSFDASGSTDPGGSITDYEWDLDGDDVYNETGAEATARHNATPAAYTYTNPQQATAHVRVTDDDGTTAVANLTVTAHGWVLVTLESGAVTDPGYWGDITLVNGNPALAYRCGGDNTLHYAYSTTATGASAGDWTIVTVPTTGIGQPGREVSLAIIGGKPAMSYCDNAGVSNGDLIYQRATTTTGANAADWIAPVHVMDTDDAGYNSELLDVSARPAIAFDDFTDNALHYAHASTMTGASAADWTTNIAIDDPAGGSANGCSLAKVDGNPAVVYNYWDGAQSNMNYCRSTSASGDSAADWATKVTFSNITGVSPSLASVASNPAFVYQDQNSGEVDYRRASDVDGGAWGSVVTIQTGMFGQYASLGIVGGFPAATYHDFSNGKLLYTQSTQADGSSGWATHETVASGSQGRYSTLLLVDSGTLPAIYFRDDSGKAARYAVKF